MDSQNNKKDEPVADMVVGQDGAMTVADAPEPKVDTAEAVVGAEVSAPAEPPSAPAPPVVNDIAPPPADNPVNSDMVAEAAKEAEAEKAAQAEQQAQMIEVKKAPGDSVEPPMPEKEQNLPVEPMETKNDAPTMQSSEPVVAAAKPKVAHEHKPSQSHHAQGGSKKFAVGIILLVAMLLSAGAVAMYIMTQDDTKESPQKSTQNVAPVQQDESAQQTESSSESDQQSPTDNPVQDTTETPTDSSDQPDQSSSGQNQTDASQDTSGQQEAATGSDTQSEDSSQETTQQSAPTQ